MPQDIEEEISKLFSTEGTTTVVLKGASGYGKLWIARKFSAHAIKKGLFDYIFWFSLARKYDKIAFYRSIASQLSLDSATEKFEVDDDVDAEDVVEEENLEVLERKILVELARKSLLLILDDEREKMQDKHILDLLPPGLVSSCKILIATTKEEERHTDLKPKRVFNVNFLSEREHLPLSKQRALYQTLQLKSKESPVEALDSVPARTSLTGEASSSVTGECDSKVPIPESSSGAACVDVNQNLMPWVCNAYDKLPNSILMDCVWRRTHLSHGSRSIHYNELVAYWILEGYLGQIDCIEKAYLEGHRILLELIDCQLLKNVETNYVLPGDGKDAAEVIVGERVMLNLDHNHNIGSGEIASLGLVEVLEDGKSGGLGRITLADGMLRTPFSSKKSRRFSTLLVDGNRLSREILHNLGQCSHEVQVLAIFTFTLPSLPPPISEMKELNMLVLRGCDLLDNVDNIQELSKLTVLEISGSSSLSSLPDNFFTNMTHLETLNLSSLGIKSLPSSFYELSELKWLILRDCPNLTMLKTIRKFIKLLVLNLSGCTSLRVLADKSLRVMKGLRTLDISYTKLKGLPILSDNTELTHILLRRSSLERLPRICTLTRLQVLDISDSKDFVEFQDTSFETAVSLKILDFSGTQVKHLPSEVSSSLQHIYLKGCSELEKLPPIEALKNLKSLYLSGSHLPSLLEDRFFKYLINLQILDLSETNLTSLPSPPGPSNLRKLLLSCCSSLEKLPNLSNLEKLEVLDLSGCSALREIPDTSFDRMTCLKSLNLSETSIEKLPSLLSLTNLHTLLLKSCTQLKALPTLTSLSKLEELNLCGVTCLGETGSDLLKHTCDLRILDLSETLLSKLPSMSNLKKLEKLFLRGCRHLESSVGLEDVKHLKVLDLSGAALKEFPSFDDFTNLHSLSLTDSETLSASRNIEKHDAPSTENQHGDETENYEELSKCHWNISTLPGPPEDGNQPLPSMNSALFFQLLEKKPVLLETDKNQFNFSVWPADQQLGEGDSLCHRDELIFRSTHFLDACFSYFKTRGRTLTICGFLHLPIQIEDLLRRAEYLFLFETAFIKDLNDLGLKNIKLLRGCWVDSCENLGSVFGEDTDEDLAECQNNLEMLWLSNNLNLKIIWTGDLQHQGFQNLKYIYLYSCPKITSVFSSLQQAKNLEFLQVTFCDKLQSLFDSSNVDSEQWLLPKLKKLHLWELPMLESIGCVMPVLESLKVGECSRIKNLLSSSLPQENLVILQISGCDILETVVEKNASVDYKLPNLLSLHLSGLPALKSFGGLLPSLQESIIRECSKLHLPLD